jgi:UrcA family protein
MIRTVPIALLMALTINMPAAAEEHVWQTGDGFSVRATDLDLRTTEGRERLLRRIDHAASRLCRGVAPRIDREGCTNEARAQALAAAPAHLRASLEPALLTREERRLAVRATESGPRP